ncbi:MAG: primosomal protein N', partial [Opitutaceae bacterium]|nr:primosomal protein N' [Opitutaceae bacterium]
MIVGVQPMAGFDKLLHYKVPEALRAEIRAGSLVRVPIGSRLHLGLVMALNAQPDCAPEKLKLISDILHDYPALTP